jgi:hypothetical protein
MYEQALKEGIAIDIERLERKKENLRQLQEQQALYAQLSAAEGSNSNTTALPGPK